MYVTRFYAILIFTLSQISTTLLTKTSLFKGLDLFFDFLYTEVPVSQQTNGYDCGMHVLYNAETRSTH